MNYILNFLVRFSRELTPFLSEIALILVVTLIAVYGGSATRIISKQFRRFNILVRLVLFNVVSFVLFGLTAIYASPLLAGWLKGLNKQYMSLVVVILFLILGFCADSKNKL